MKQRHWRSIALIAACVWAVVPASPGQTEVAKLLPDDGALEDHFGDAVALDGLTAVVGKQFDDEAGENAGAAYVFVFDGENWVQQAKLTPYDRAYSDKFGCSVAIDGDLIVVGAEEEDDAGVNAGAAYVFKLHNGIWVQQQKLIAEDGSPDGLFGRKVAVSGERIIVGTAGFNYTTEYAGSAYVFRYDGDQWTQEALLAVIDGDTADMCDMSVDIDGDAAVIGAPLDDVADRDSGSVYVFRFDGESWAQQQKIAPADGVKLDFFGCDASISGEMILIGAYGVDEGDGAAYAYGFDGSQWTQQNKFGGGGGANFGISVDLQGYNAVMGARNASLCGVNKCGTAIYLHFDGQTWSTSSLLLAIDYAPWDYFGWDAAISGNYMFVGAPRNDDNGSNSGAAYMFMLHACPGDLDGNHTVNLQDLAVLLAYYSTPVGAAYEHGDLDDDGDVDLNDLAYMLGVYGTNCE